MKNLTYKFATGIATATLIAAVFAPVASAQVVEISGNGAGSVNGVTTSNTNTTSVSQSNTSNVVNTVSAKSNTGGNNANSNTGGNTAINTGSATTIVSVGVSGSTNTATLGNCCCEGGPVVLIHRNGAGSLNGVTLTKTNTLVAGQGNGSNITNTVRARARTGKNNANSNTNGTNNITTNPALTNVGVSVTGSSNALDQKCCCDPLSGGVGTCNPQ